MSINITPKSLDTELNELMRGVSSGKIQLPDFQRDLRALRPPWAAAVTKDPGGKGAGPNPPG